MPTLTLTGSPSESPNWTLTVDERQREAASAMPTIVSAIARPGATNRNSSGP